MGQNLFGIFLGMESTTLLYDIVFIEEILGVQGTGVLRDSQIYGKEDDAIFCKGSDLQSVRIL